MNTTFGHQSCLITPKDDSMIQGSHISKNRKFSFFLPNLAQLATQNDSFISFLIKKVKQNLNE